MARRDLESQEADGHGAVTPATLLPKVNPLFNTMIEQVAARDISCGPPRPCFRIRQQGCRYRSAPISGKTGKTTDDCDHEKRYQSLLPQSFSQHPIRSIRRSAQFSAPNHGCSFTKLCFSFQKLLQGATVERYSSTNWKIVIATGCTFEWHFCTTTDHSIRTTGGFPPSDSGLAREHHP